MVFTLMSLAVYSLSRYRCSKGKMADKNNVEIIKLMFKCDPDVKSASGHEELLSTLKKAIKCGNTDMVMYLLDRGVDVDEKGGLGLTLLMNAVKYGAIDVVKLLIDQGADVNTKTQKGKTALNYCRSPDIEALLRESGAK